MLPEYLRTGLEKEFLAAQATVLYDASPRNI